MEHNKTELEEAPAESGQSENDTGEAPNQHDGQPDQPDGQPDQPDGQPEEVQAQSASGKSVAGEALGQLKEAPAESQGAAGEDFSQLFEESLRTVKPGEVVRGSEYWRGSRHHRYRL